MTYDQAIAAVNAQRAQAAVIANTSVPNFRRNKGFSIIAKRDLPHCVYSACVTLRCRGKAVFQ